jgi:UDP-N-acetylmuramyl pentapeptide synthase
MMPAIRLFRRLTLTFALSTATLGLLAAASAPLHAEQRGPVQRVIQGKVETKDGASIKGAVVYLKDGHTSSVRSAITSDDGTYRFGQLTLNTDYDIWATSEGKKSDVKSISSFDSKREFNINLKID